MTLKQLTDTDMNSLSAELCFSRAENSGRIAIRQFSLLLNGKGHNVATIKQVISKIKILVQDDKP